MWTSSGWECTKGNVSATFVVQTVFKLLSFSFFVNGQYEGDNGATAGKSNPLEIQISTHIVSLTLRFILSCIKFLLSVINILIYTHVMPDEPEKVPTLENS